MASTLTFAAWSQSAIGAAIEAVDDGRPALGPAAFTPSAILVGGPAPKPVSRAKPLVMLGPGGVAGLDPGVVSRVFPAAGSGDARSNDLVAVELAREELPWLLTPASAGASRLRPWLVLVVVDAATPFDLSTRPLPTLRVSPKLELPDLSDSWAWAHVQRGAAGDNGISRLLCPRKLEPFSRYRACVVPAFEGGRAAGVGDSGPATDSHSPAWDVRAADAVALPVYHWWEFGTGQEGDFEDLVRRLGPAGATSGLGAVDVDVSQPWPGGTALAGTGGVARLPVSGAMHPVRASGGDPQPDPLPLEAVLDFRARLSHELGVPADRLEGTHDPNDTTGAVAPPIYGGRHVGVDRVESSPELPLPDLGWVVELNLDPANRIAAGIATQYVRDNQEDLMARAWEQVGAIREANRRLALAELSTEVSGSVHRRHVKTLSAGELVRFAAPAAMRLSVKDPPLSMHVSASPLPDAAATAAFGRLMRPFGFVARRSKGSLSTIVERGLRGDLKLPEAKPLLPQATDGSQLTPGDAASQVVLLDAVRRVAEVSSLQSAAGIVSQQLGSIEGLDMDAVATADLPAVEASLAPQMEAVQNAMRSLAGADFAGEQADDGRVVSPVGVQLQVDDLAEGVRQALEPGDRIARRLASRIGGPGAPGAPVLGPVMSYPEFPAPMALAMLRSTPEWFLPGLGAFPPENVALLEANANFIESYMVGLNQALMSELLWREYPTDRRGSPFRHFWPRPSMDDDIPPIDGWDAGGALGGHETLAAGELVILLVRGEVVRRFPDMIVTAVKGFQGDLVPAGAPFLSPNPDDVRQALFVIPVDPSTAAYAFAVPSGELPPHRPGWFFVFQEHDYRMRFGFDLLLTSSRATRSGAGATWTGITSTTAAASRRWPGGSLRRAPTRSAGPGASPAPTRCRSPASPCSSRSALPCMRNCS